MKRRRNGRSDRESCHCDRFFCHCDRKSVQGGEVGDRYVGSSGPEPSPGVVGEMADGKDCGGDEKQLAFTPSDGLLVPEACDDAQHGESEAQG